MIAQFGNVDPKEAIAQFERRFANPVETFSWLDVWQATHAQMFTVAKSAGYDILGDVIAALDDAIKRGETFEQFSRDLIPVLQAKGWWGKAPAIDPLTGEELDVQLGSVRRLQTIYDTNMRVSFNAGRWARADRVKEERPYLRYLHTVSEHPRHSHLQWVNVTLPFDDVFWKTHLPPNGWGCKCSFVTLSERQYQMQKEQGLIRTEAPVIEFVPFLNKRTGLTIQTPKGIDPGFGYNAGEAFLNALKKAA